MHGLHKKPVSYFLLIEVGESLNYKYLVKFIQELKKTCLAIGRSFTCHNSTQKEEQNVETRQHHSLKNLKSTCYITS